MGLIKSFDQDRLRVRIFQDRSESGRAASSMAVEAILDSVQRKGRANVIFAAAPSQNEMLAGLIADKRVPWAKVNAFHLDEYHTLPVGAPQRFDVFLRERIWDIVKPGSIYPVVPKEGLSIEAINERYEELMARFAPDLALLGVGENGHLAFVDPPFADFDDKDVIREVELDEVCRNQQVNDGAFPSITEVPKKAVTMTIPAMMRSRTIVAVVPGPRKADAIKAMLQGPIETACPASILRTHRNCALFLDAAAASKL